MTIFVASATGQGLMIYFLSHRSVGGYPHSALGVYYPFLDLVEPFVSRYYGGGGAGLGPLLMWTFVTGIFAYSVVLAFISAWFGKGRRSDV